MGVFDMAQSVVAQAAGIIGSDASIDISSVMTDLEPRLMEMDLGPLFGLWFQSLFICITMWALYICIFIVIYGRMIEIYLVTSVAPVPMAAMMGKEWGGMGQNYLRSLLALGFQAFLIIVCVAIYAVLVQNIALEEVIVFKEYSVDRNGDMKHVSECLTDQWSNARDRRLVHSARHWRYQRRHDCHRHGAAVEPLCDGPLPLR